MRFACDKCSAKYTISDEKIRGKIVTYKCAKCGNKISVNGKSLALEEAEGDAQTRVASIGDLEALRASSKQPKAASDLLPDGWYAIVNRKQIGPLAGAEMLSKIGEGKITARTYLWRDGQGDWKRAADVPLVAPMLAPTVARHESHPAQRKVSSSAPPRRNGGARVVEESRQTEPHVDLSQSERPVTEPADLEEAFARARPFDDLLRTSDREGRAPAPTEAPRDLLAGARGKGAKATSGRHGVAETRSASMAKEAAVPLANADLNALLFDDAQDIMPTQVGAPLTDLASAVADDLKQKADGSGPDPFAQVAGGSGLPKLGVPGEETRFVIKQAGVHQRNPPWKIVLFAASVIMLPVSLLYLLSMMNIGFLQVGAGEDEHGREVKVSVFSSEGFENLRDRLLKKTPPKPKPKPRPEARPATDKEVHADEGPLVAKPNIEMGPSMTDAERQRMKEALRDTDSTGPKVNEAMLQAKLQVDGKSGLDSTQINEVYAKNAKAFQGCVEAEIRRNPQFSGGKVTIGFTVGTSGVVTRASVDRPEIDKADIGACLREKAKRMVFPSFEGEPVSVELPLVLSRGM